jgi:pimeloyl-ACP methyl ester carboxylesterase
MKPLVVLLHGLARSHGSLSTLDAHLRANGFDTIARTYPSRRRPIAELADDIATWLADAAGDRPLHAVTHSMGGVVARHLHDPRLRWQRIVMLAPPNRGSRLAAGLADNALFRWFFGPAGSELGDGSQWPRPPVPVAVIAGTRNLALGNPTSWTVGRRFPAGVRNDGTVAVDETKLDAADMAAFAEVDATHTWIMNAPHTLQLVTEFLRDGVFGAPR